MPTDLLGSADIDDVADPLGGALQDYVATASLLAQLVDQLVVLAWPGFV